MKNRKRERDEERGDSLSSDRLPPRISWCTRRGLGESPAQKDC